MTTRVPIWVWVASRVLASWNAYSLNVTAASSWDSRSRGFFGGTKYRSASKMWLSTAGRPVVVGEVPARRPEQQREVGEELERVGAPGLVAARVDGRRQLVGQDALDVGAVPRAEQAAVQDPLDGLDHAQVLRRDMPPQDEIIEWSPLMS